MGGIASVLYGVLAYLLFLGTFLYAIAFVGNLPVPKTIDSGAAGPLVPALDRQHPAARAVRHPAQRHGAARRSSAGGPGSCRIRSSAPPMCCSRAWRSLLLYWQWRPMPDADLVGDQSCRRRDPAGGLLDRLGGRADQHVPDQSFRAVRPAAGLCPAARPRRCRRRCSGRRSSTSGCGIRSISASCSPSGRRRR